MEKNLKQYIKGSPELMDMFKELPSSNFSLSLFGINVYVDNAYPIDLTVLASDVETREEIRIKTGEQIIGVLHSNDSNVFLTKIKEKIK